MLEHSEPIVTARRWNELTIESLYDIVKLRTDVFYLEQRIDESELDGRDREPDTHHVWAESDGQPVAYLRVLTNDKPEYGARRVIGRVVTHPDHRGRGLAQVLLRWTVDEFGGEPLILHSQSYVCDLYSRFGFAIVGDEFYEAGIAHRTMVRPAQGDGPR